MTVLEAITRTTGLTAVVLLAAWTLLGMSGGRGRLRSWTAVPGFAAAGAYGLLAAAQGALIGGLTAVIALAATAGGLAHLAMRVLPSPPADVEQPPAAAPAAAAALHPVPTMSPRPGAATTDAPGRTAPARLRTREPVA